MDSLRVIATARPRHRTARTAPKTADRRAHGYFDLDRMTSGFQPGDLIVLAARRRIDKTAFAEHRPNARGRQRRPAGGH
jgi:replicative DNA helicase